MAPKFSTKKGSGAGDADAIQVELPGSAPFPVDWRPLVHLVLVDSALSEAALRDAAGRLHAARVTSLAELRAGLEADDALAQELTVAEKAHLTAGGTADTFSPAPATIVQLVQREFRRGEEVAWQQEYVVRHKELEAAGQEAAAAKEAAAVAKIPLDEALQLLVSAEDAGQQPQVAGAGATAAGPEASFNGDALRVESSAAASGRASSEVSSVQLQDPSAAAAASATAAALPATAGVYDDVKQEEVAAAVAEAQAAYDDAAAVANAAERRLAAATAAMEAKLVAYQSYWVDGLAGSSLEQLLALRELGVPIRSLIWVHATATTDSDATAGGTVAATVVTPPPALWTSVNDACTGPRPWPALNDVAVLDLPVGSAASSVFSSPAADADVAAPDWQLLDEPKEAVPATGKGSAPKAPAQKPAGKAAVGAAAKPGTPLAAAVHPQDIPGVKELGRALLTLRCQLMAYDGWCQNVKLYPLEAEQVPSMAHYQHMMDSVPTEQTSAALVLHAMLEQVAHNCQALEETAAGEQELAAAEAAAALQRAFETFGLAEGPIFAPQRPPAKEHALVHEGDDLALAAHGMFSGYIAGDLCQALPAAPGAVGGPLQALQPVDVSAAEAHMLELALRLGDDCYSRATAGSNGVEAAIARSLRSSSIRAHCADGLAPGAVGRFELLTAAVEMLPPGVRAAHGESILGRHHTEQLLPDVLKQTLMKAATELPDSCATYFPLQDACLVSCFAGATSSTARLEAPIAISFREYWDSFLAAAGHCPVLTAKAYQTGGRVAPAASNNKYLFTQDACIVRSEHSGGLTVSKNGTHVRYSNSGDQPMVIVTGPGGMVLRSYELPAELIRGNDCAELDVKGSDQQTVLVFPDGNCSTGGADASTTETAVAESPGRADAAATDAPQVAPATATAVSCVTAYGAAVELTTEGRVMMCPPQRESVQPASARGVAVLGAPIQGGELAPLLPPQTVEWRAALPGGAIATRKRLMGGGAHTRIVFVDGSVSEYDESASERGWVRIELTGERCLHPDPSAPEPPPPPPLQPAVDPAAAAADARPPSAPSAKLVSKNARRRTSEDNKAPAAGSTPEQGAAPVAVAPEAAAPAAEPPAPLQPVQLPPLRCAEVTDLDTGASIITREDLAIIIRYPDGNLLIQEADGARLSWLANSGTWTYECDHLPPVMGDQNGVRVAACPDVSLEWTASTRTVSVKLGDGCELMATPDGLLGFAPQARDMQPFVDAAALYTAEARRLAAAPPFVTVPDDATVAAVAADKADGGNAAPNPRASLATVQESAEDATDGQGPKTVEAVAEAPPPPEPAEELLERVCMQEGCQGIFVFELAGAGAAAMCESEDCYLATRAGCAPVVWPEQPQDSGPASLTDHQENQADGAEDDGEAAAAAAAQPPVVTPPQPVAPSIRPRLFVTFPPSGDGYEILDAQSFELLQRSKALQPWCRMETHPVTGADEPGTLSHVFMTQHVPRSPLLQPLPVATTAVVRPFDVASATALPALKRPSHVTAPPRTPGIMLPRVIAGAAVVRQPYAAVPPPPPLPVISLREIRQHPQLDAGTVSRIEAALAGWRSAQQQQELTFKAMLPLADERSDAVKAQEEEVAAHIALLRQEKLCSCQQAVEALKAEGAEREAELQRQQQEQQAAEAARRAGPQKERKPYPKKVGPFDNAPKRPQPGEVLPYFQCEEGLIALQSDPLLQPASHISRNTLPPPHAPTAASPGAVIRPGQGVYLASKTQLGGPEPGQQRISSSGSIPAYREPSPASVPYTSESPRSTRSTLQPGRMITVTQPYVSSDSGAAAPLSASIKSHHHDVYGQPRTLQPALPAIYTQDEADVSLNTRYLEKEADALVMTKTSSTSLMRHQGKGLKQFTLTPAHLHFGSVPLGAVAHRTAKLLNTSTERARFSVVRPELPLRVIYKPGPLAAGMATMLTVELVAERVGDFVGEVQIKSELNVLTLSCSAKIVAGPATEAAQPDTAGMHEHGELTVDV